jgi:hypothetical protein
MLLSRTLSRYSRTFKKVHFEKTLRTRLELCKERKVIKFLFKRGFALIPWKIVFKAWVRSNFVTKSSATTGFASAFWLRIATSLRAGAWVLMFIVVYV